MSQALERRTRAYVLLNEFEALLVGKETRALATLSETVSNDLFDAENC